MGTLPGRHGAGELLDFDALYREHHAYLFAICLRMVKDYEDAEDCVQESFARAFRFRADFQGTCKVSSWLYTIARRVCLHFLLRSKYGRLRKLTGSLEEMTSAQEPRTEPVADLDRPADAQQMARLQAAIDRLPEKLQGALAEYLKGHTLSSSAQRLNITVDAMKSRRCRAIQELKRRLTQ